MIERKKIIRDQYINQVAIAAPSVAQKKNHNENKFSASLTKKIQLSKSLTGKWIEVQALSEPFMSQVHVP